MSCNSSSDSLEISLPSSSSSCWSCNALSSAVVGASWPACRNASDGLCAGAWHSSSIMADNSSDGWRGCRLKGRSCSISFQSVIIQTSVNKNGNTGDDDDDDDGGKLDNEDVNDNDDVDNNDIDDDKYINDRDVYLKLGSEAY